MALPAKIRVNAQFPFPATVTGTGGIVVTKQSGIWTISLTGGGAGNPGGSSGQVQWNNAGAFAGFTLSGDGTLVTSTGALTITPGAVTLAKMASLAANSVIGNNTGAPATPIAVTQTQLTAMVNTFTSGLSGAVPASGGGSTNFLRADGTFAVPPGAGGTPGGTNTQLQYNNATAFGGIANITSDGTNLTGVRLKSTTSLDWDSGAGAVDISLFRDAASILAQRVGTVAQSLRIYNTFTDASNYERGVIDWTTTANLLTIGTQKAGSGTFRNVVLLGNLIGVSNTSFTPLGPLHTVGSAGRTTWTAVGDETIVCENNANTALTIVGGTGGAHFSIIRFTNPSIVEDERIIADLNNHTLGFRANQTDHWQITAIGNFVPLAGGYIQWGGQARVTSDFSVTSSTVLINVTGLSVNVQAGRTYQFETELYITDAAAGGVQAAIAGTATATAIQYTGYTIADNAIKAKTNATALATAVGSTTTTETAGIIVRITGTITVNAAGTLTVQMAQNTSNGTATIAKRGSWFLVQDMP